MSTHEWETQFESFATHDEGTGDGAIALAEVAEHDGEQRSVLSELDMLDVRLREGAETLERVRGHVDGLLRREQELDAQLAERTQTLGDLRARLGELVRDFDARD